MAFVPGYKSRIAGGSLSLSAYVTDWTESANVDVLEVTVLSSPGNARVFIPGQTMSNLSFKGFLDLDGSANTQYDQAKTWFESAATEPVTVAPSGLAFGSEVLLSASLPTKNEIGAATSSPVTFGLDCQNSGVIARGWSLHDETAQTADGSSAAHDGGAASTTGGIAHLHVTAYSGLTSAVVTIEDSSTGSSGWAVIGTFATVTALTSERLVIAGAIKRYTRCTVDVTGTGSVTYVCGLART